MFGIEYGLFDKLCTITSFKTPIIQVTKSKDLSAQSLTIISKVAFQTMVLYQHCVNKSINR